MLWEDLPLNNVNGLGGDVVPVLVRELILPRHDLFLHVFGDCLGGSLRVERRVAT